MSPVSHVPGGLRIAVKATPRASANRVRGVARDASGVVSLLVSVTAVPEDGKANKAVIAILAKRWRLAKSAIEIVQGATDRRKVLEITSDEPDELRTHILADIQTLS